jgi:hypothetical protein
LLQRRRRWVVDRVAGGRGGGGWLRRGGVLLGEGRQASAGARERVEAVVQAMLHDVQRALAASEAELGGGAV